jgi:hypothetical protein
MERENWGELSGGEERGRGVRGVRRERRKGN